MLNSRRLLLVLALCAVWPGAANGQEPGVFVDPDSPSGKEYALPFDDARRDADDPSEGRERRGNGAGEGSAAPGGGGPSGSAPLFGAGISSDRSGGGGSEDRREPPGGRVGARPSVNAPNGENLALAEESAEALPAAAADADGGFSGRGPIAVVLAVLAVGGLAGLALKRWTGQQDL